ncbi:unnamed protein product [Amoebophrya sp. A120]|nr:unnamed protein product [Amoebophrya sp. A120]|eukprot:GSA120T00008532001.1
MHELYRRVGPSSLFSIYCTHIKRSTFSFSSSRLLFIPTTGTTTRMISGSTTSAAASGNPGGRAGSPEHQPTFDASFDAVLQKIQQELASSQNSETLAALLAKSKVGAGRYTAAQAKAATRPEELMNSEVDALDSSSSPSTSPAVAQEKSQLEEKFMPANILAAFLERKMLKEILEGQDGLFSKTSNTASEALESGFSPSSTSDGTNGDAATTSEDDSTEMSRRQAQSPGATAASTDRRNHKSGTTNQPNNKAKPQNLKPVKYVFDANDLNTFFSEEGWTILLWLAHLGCKEEKDSIDDCGKVGCCEVEQQKTPKQFLNQVYSFTEALLQDYAPILDVNTGGEYDKVRPLTFAIDGANEEMTDLFLKYGADPFLEDDEGECSVDLAAKLLKEQLEKEHQAESVMQNGDIGGGIRITAGGHEDDDENLVCDVSEVADIRDFAQMRGGFSTAGVVGQKNKEKDGNINEKNHGTTSDKDESGPVLDYRWLRKYSWVQERLGGMKEKS